jgi:hypothetical protein
MNKFDLGCIYGYIKTGLMHTRKIKKAKSLDEAVRIASEIENKAMQKLEGSTRDLQI